MKRALVGATVKDLLGGELCVWTSLCLRSLSPLTSLESQTLIITWDYLCCHQSLYDLTLSFISDIWKVNKWPPNSSIYRKLFKLTCSLPRRRTLKYLAIPNGYQTIMGSWFPGAWNVERKIRKKQKIKVAQLTTKI